MSISVSRTSRATRSVATTCRVRVSYERVVTLVRRIVADGHVRLVETLAERIAAGVLADPRIRVVRIRVEKLDVFEEIAAVGVEIERRPRSPTTVQPNGI